MSHAKLDLTEGVEMNEVDPFRPLISLWLDKEDDDSDVISVSIGAAWGAAQRYLTLKPREARALARMLTVAADQAEADSNKAA